MCNVLSLSMETKLPPSCIFKHLLGYLRSATAAAQAPDIEFPSPIAIFPKPLGLSYRNFNAQYNEHAHDGTRCAAGSALVSAMLLHYFPDPDFSREKINVDVSPILTVPDRTNDVAYWLVTRQNVDGTPSEAAAGEPTLPLIVTIITCRRFVDLKERKKPGKLKFAASAIRTDGAILIGDKSFRRGTLIMLAGKTRPLHPGFEFYTFDVDGEDENAQCLTPWQPDVLGGKNTVLMGISEVEKVDEVFKNFTKLHLGGTE
ncbi:hypothetical protein P154DRAFT_121444 [Amniculicola lignicola CBS 123094]|uniref:Uncharacterized protein n=1 Tax=Amniculicola lignicola CBS 123094 TaxID=1392246 RepID=A0A6A5X3Y6_9PLEO|nr:hypothetical protein P154DRAFT_121444 [Amniculicola lignicola CBS 123094]